MSVVGSVKEWREEEGWGVLVSSNVDGTVFAHFSHIKAEGFRSLSEGERVEFEYETPGQDGCEHRATWVRALA
jgi:CspA family cold shock protein